MHVTETEREREALWDKCCGRRCREKGETPSGCQLPQGRVFRLITKTRDASPSFREQPGRMRRDPEPGERGLSGNVWRIAVGYTLCWCFHIFLWSCPSEIFFFFPFQTTRYGTLSFSSWPHQQNSLFSQSRHVLLRLQGRVSVEKTLILVDPSNH